MAAKRKSEEEREQIKLAQFLDSLGLVWEHIPNETGQRATPGLLSKRRRLGVKAGSPDVRIYDRPPNLPGCVGVAIELKAVGCRASPEQDEWIGLLSNRGWAARVCCGAYAAIDWLHFLGYGRRGGA